MRPIIDRAVIFPAAVLLVLAIAVVAHARTPASAHAPAPATAEREGGLNVGANGYTPGVRAHVGISRKF